MPTIAELQAQLDKLAAFDCGPYPVLSLYLDLRPNDRGRDNFEHFSRTSSRNGSPLTRKADLSAKVSIAMWKRSGIMFVNSTVR
jgi:hypothetical protein